MTIEKFISLHAKSKTGYIKHLEELSLDTGDCSRCYHCNRVDLTDNMSEVLDGGAYVCDTCLPAWDRDEQSVKEIAESDEADYQYAKRGY